VLWLGVHTQLVVESLDGDPIGLVTSYGADLRSGHTKVACVLRPDYQRRGWPFEGVLRFVAHLFTHWPLRKVYFEAPAPVAVETGLATAGAGVLVREACLTEHDRFEGELVDLVIFALTRERFYERFASVLERAEVVS
jgi:RimJ/RimL family protein N-acetyltransferase